jgi:hypothetical protein
VPDDVAELLEGTVDDLLIEGESRIIIPKKGKVFEADGTCKVAIIRPCVSRGRRVRNLPPIYTPEMLAENAAVFNGWVMYMDHLTEGIVELMEKKGRSIRELGGRVVESFYRPDHRGADDDDYGYRPGAVVGRVLPQPPVRAMLEADPEILHVSINAYPKAVREGVAPWNPSLKGMLIEGIRRRPEGSVDWVPRGGAGGRVLQEWEEAAVSLLEAYYDSEREDNDMPNWKNMNAEQLTEALQKENPELAKELGLAEGRTTTVTVPATPATTGLTQEELQRALQEQRDALVSEFETKLEERDQLVEEEVESLLSERESARAHERIARKLIKDAALPARWTEDLYRRYAVLPSGPSPALLTEAAGDQSAEDVLVESVKADITHARELIAESGGSPMVGGLGGGAGQLSTSRGMTSRKRPCRSPSRP